MVIVGLFQMKYSLFEPVALLKIVCQLDRRKDTEIKKIKMVATRYSTTTITVCTLFGSLGVLVSWTSWVRKAEKHLKDQIRGTELLWAKPWQGCSQEQPISQHLGILALQTSSPKRFKGHPRSSRSWVVVGRLYSWTEGLNMVIVNLCPFVALIPDLFPAPPLLGLGMHQISWFPVGYSVIPVCPSALR